MQTKNIDPTNPPRRAALNAALYLGVLAWAPLALSQVEDDDDGIFELSPFEVTGDEDEGYRATSTLAGTRIRTDLKDVGTAISVYTEEFLSDIGATDNGSLLQYTTNAEVAGTQGTYAGLGNGTTLDETDSLRNPSTQNRIRGLTAADNTRDYYVTDIPWDSYNVDRVDIQRGPNSFIFGLGSPAGIINASLADAAMENEGEAEIRFGSYGSVRTSFSLNRVLAEDTLAVRVAALMDHAKFNQDPAFEDDERFYGAIRWQPKFGGESMKTTLRGKFETGKVDANRPRIVPPNDSVSPWFQSSAVSASNPYGGMDKFTADYAYNFGTNYTGDQPYQNSMGINQQQPFWLINGSDGSVMDVRAGYINPGARNPDGSVRGAAQGIAGKAYGEQFFGVGSLSGAAANLGLRFADSGQYRDRSLRDASIFDFNNNLIDGDTKSEFEEWDAYNLDFSQTWLNDRLGLQLTYDKQEYLRGGEAFLGNSPTISIDILENYLDLSANPNLGRPFVATGAGGSGNSYDSEREYNRASLFAELRAEDFLEKDSMLERLLGKHRINAVYSTEDYKTTTQGWQRHATSQQWDDYWNGVTGSGSSIQSRPPVGVVYLGPSLAGASSAAGANIPRVTGSVDLASANPYLFDSNWNATGVAFDAPWTVPASLQVAYPPDGFPTANGQTQWLQNSNPANYVGWNRNVPLDLWSYNMGADPRLITSKQLSQRETDSIAATWQAFLWNEAIVATFGWREDEVKGRAKVAGRLAGTPRTPLDLGITLPSDYTPPSGSVFKDDSTSTSVVVHLNKLFGDDPLPLNVTLSYSESSNFQVTDTRRDIFGTPINNPSGDSQDYGVLLSTKDGKYSFRAIKYESEVALASAQLSNAGGIGTIVQQGLRFRNVYLYDLGVYDWETRDAPQGRNNASNAYPLDGNGPYFVGEGTSEEVALEDAWISQWNQIQADLTENGFLDAWGLNPVPLSDLVTRSQYLADPAGNAPSNTALVNAYVANAPSGFTVTADTVSKGYEYEFTANPTENWRIAVNASKTEAFRNNVGGDLLDQFVAYLDEKLVDTEAGNMPQFGNPGLSIYNHRYSPWRGNYVQLKLAEGTNVPELRKWRYNVVTNYSFTDGALKNVGIGGSYRWQDKVGIGYPIDPNAAQSTFVIDDPIYGPSEDAIDLWATYSRPLNDKIDWRIQLNIRNAFADDELIPISVQPSIPGETADFASVRIAPIQEWFITNTFSF